MSELIVVGYPNSQKAEEARGHCQPRQTRSQLRQGERP